MERLFNNLATSHLAHILAAWFDEPFALRMRRMEDVGLDEHTRSDEFGPIQSVRFIDGFSYCSTREEHYQSDVYTIVDYIERYIHAGFTFDNVNPAHLHMNADYSSDEDETVHDCHGKWQTNEAAAIRNRYRQWRNGGLRPFISLLAVPNGLADSGDDDDDIPGLEI